MKRILLSASILIAVGAFLFFTVAASNGGSAQGTYKIELDNAFGLVQGADFKVAGVRAGTINDISLDPKTYHAIVTVQVTQPGFGQFHNDAFCQSRPQSLIGEYFIECQPGTQGAVLKPGSTIPVKNTESTIPADLLQNVMRMPYRERFTLIINELGAAVAGRSGDLGAALRRAVPAITQTDNLLNLLGNDAATLQSLTTNSNHFITALADNSHQVERFITEANRISIDTAAQSSNLEASLQRLPPFLEQLKPAMQKLGAATQANTPVLQNLNTAAGQIDRLFTDLPPFAHSSLPAIKSLGKASVVGTEAVKAANPTISHLNAFAKSTPELGQNLAIVLHDLDDRSRAVEADPRSPGGQGFTGLEALLQYAFVQPLAINTFGPFGHQLAVDAFTDARCSPYATPSTIANGLKSFGARYRDCYSWLGPNQPGVNTTDPSNPSAAVPDPGGAPPGFSGPATSAAKLQPARAPTARAASVSRSGSGGGAASSSSSAAGGASGSGGSSGPSAGAPSHSGGGTAGGKGSGKGGGLGLQSTLGTILSALGGSGGSSGGSTSTAAPAASSGNQAQQLLNYLLAP